MKNREIEHSNAALNANIERESSLRQDIVMLRQDVARQEAAFESSQQALYDARTVVRIQERQLNDDRVRYIRKCSVGKSNHLSRFSAPRF